MKEYEERERYIEQLLQRNPTLLNAPSRKRRTPVAGATRIQAMDEVNAMDGMDEVDN